MSAAPQSQSLSVQQVRVQQQQLLLLLLQQVLLLLQLQLQLLKQLKHPSLMATGVIGVLGDLALRLVVEELKTGTGSYSCTLPVWNLYISSLLEPVTPPLPPQMVEPLVKETTRTRDSAEMR